MLLAFALLDGGSPSAAVVASDASEDEVQRLVLAARGGD